MLCSKSERRGRAADFAVWATLPALLLACTTTGLAACSANPCRVVLKLLLFGWGSDADLARLAAPGGRLHIALPRVIFAMSAPPSGTGGAMDADVSSLATMVDDLDMGMIAPPGDDGLDLDFALEDLGDLLVPINASGSNANDAPGSFIGYLDDASLPLPSFAEDGTNHVGAEAPLAAAPQLLGHGVATTTTNKKRAPATVASYSAMAQLQRPPVKRYAFSSGVSSFVWHHAPLLDTGQERDTQLVLRNQLVLVPAPSPTPREIRQQWRLLALRRCLSAVEKSAKTTGKGSAEWKCVASCRVR